MKGISRKSTKIKIFPLRPDIFIADKNCGTGCNFRNVIFSRVEINGHRQKQLG